MRDKIIKALLSHAKGANPAGIGEHSDVMGAIEQELDMIAKYHDQVDVINTYFRGKDRVNLNEGS